MELNIEAQDRNLSSSNIAENHKRKINDVFGDTARCRRAQESSERDQMHTSELEESIEFLQQRLNKVEQENSALLRRNDILQDQHDKSVVENGEKVRDLKEENEHLKAQLVNSKEGIQKSSNPAKDWSILTLDSRSFIIIYTILDGHKPIFSTNIFVYSIIQLY